MTVLILILRSMMIINIKHLKRLIATVFVVYLVRLWIYTSMSRIRRVTGAACMPVNPTVCNVFVLFREGGRIT